MDPYTPEELEKAADKSLSFVNQRYAETSQPSPYAHLMNTPRHIDPRHRKSRNLDPAAADARQKRRIARAKRETPDAYAARILRELEHKQERADDFDL